MNLSDAQKQQIQDAFSNLKNSIINQIDEFDTQVTTIFQLNTSSEQTPAPNLPIENQPSNASQIPPNFATEELKERQSQISHDLGTYSTVPQVDTDDTPDLNQINQEVQVQASQIIPEINPQTLNLSTPIPTPTVPPIQPNLNQVASQLPIAPLPAAPTPTPQANPNPLSYNPTPIPQPNPILENQNLETI